MTEEQGQAWDAEIELRKEPFRVKVGDTIYEFVPELDTELFIDAYRGVREVREEAKRAREGAQDFSVEDLERLNESNVRYISKLMLPASAKEFQEKPPPNRVMTIMAQTIMEHYGMRPTGPSSDSSTGSSTGGRRSTGPSRSKA